MLYGYDSNSLSEALLLPKAVLDRIGAGASSFSSSLRSHFELPAGMHRSIEGFLSHDLSLGILANFAEYMLHKTSAKREK